MKTCRGTQEQLTQLNDSLNAHYGYPNAETLTETYSKIQTEFGTGEFCLMILAKDVSFAESIPGIVIQDGNTIATEPMPTMEEQVPAPIIEPAVVPEII